jgi:hypothetical protein
LIKQIKLNLWRRGCSSSHRDGAVIVAMPLVRMMKVALHEIVFMSAVRNRFMSASSPMRMLTVVRAARVSGRASRRIRSTLRQGMLIDMPLMRTVKVPIVHVIHVPFVFDRSMPTARTVRMRVLIMRFVIAHLT